MIRCIHGQVKKIKAITYSTILSFPKKVQCNICGWTGSHFLSDEWHRYINCPKCFLGIKQRLFFAALQYLDEISFEKLFTQKRVLHFAPEKIVGSKIKEKSLSYISADFIRKDCDLKLDISDMKLINDASFDIVVVFDVLEHVPNYQKALEEIRRILSPKGFAIFTVPQKDGLSHTFEDSRIENPKERKKHFGQWDHLRIFGNDFQSIVEQKGFKVTVISESNFPKVIVTKHVLFPPVLSKHSLATNYRKVFFAQKA